MNLAHSSYQPLAVDQEVENSSEILAYPARHWPEKTALICRNRQWSFAQLDRLANQFAHAVSEQFNEHSGPVAIMSQNSAEYAITHFGTARTGRYSVNLPTRCTTDDIVHALELTKPCVVIVNADYKEVVDTAYEKLGLPASIIITDTDDTDSGTSFWQFISGQNDSYPEHVIEADRPGTVIFTGGTTGNPKAVVSSQRARAVSAMAGIEDFRIRPDYIAGYSVPFTHTAGLFSWFQPAVLAGCTGVIVPKWDPAQFMELTETHGINVIFAVPTQLAKLLEHPEFEPERLRSLKMIAFGGASLSRALIEKAEKCMPWLECARAYGSTETGHLAAQVKSDRAQVYDGFNQPGGRLEIEIFKEPGVVAEVGETGEIATRGAHLMTRYLNDEKATSDFFKSNTTTGDWGWMGDLARRHENYFSIVGRSKHMILSGGLNISPSELEDILIGHPSVSDCVVFGLEDATWGELPAAAVVSSQVVDEQTLIDYVGTRVADYKRLRKIFYLEKISRTAAGKAQVEKVKQECLSQLKNAD